MTDPRDIAQYVAKFEGFAQQALPGAESVELLRSISDELLQQQ
ncbi:hypothetical protein [Streptomyces sp. NPDC056061]